MNGYSSSPIPPKRRDVKWVERLNGGQVLEFTCYSPAIWAFDTHYTSAGTKPCYEDKTLCEGGHVISTLRWKGYLYGFSYRRNENCFVQLTEECGRKLFELVEKDVPLRGLRFKFSRTPHKKGRMNVEVLTYASRKLDGMPPDMDPRRSVENLWKVPPLEHVLSARLCLNSDAIPFFEKAG